MIESVHIMTKEEMKDFISSFAKKNKEKKTKAVEYLESIKNQIIDRHSQFEEERRQEYYQQKRDLIKLMGAWREKKCVTCNARLRLVNGPTGSFWGCANYRSGPGHSNFSTDYDERLSDKFKHTYVRVKSTWTTDIMRSLNMPSFVRATDLLQFFIQNDLEDLRAKYGYKPSSESISGYIIAKKKSTKEEKEIIEFLKKHFPTVIYQVGFRYKLAGQPEKVVILDAIVSDDKSVTIVEIKTEAMQIEESQLELYHSLISFLLNKENDCRELNAVFIVYNRDQFGGANWVTSPYIYFTDIKDLSSKEDLIKLFESKSLF